MLTTSDIKNCSKIPDFIKNQAVFAKHNLHIQKVFPEIGLENFSVPAKWKMADELTPATVKLCAALKKVLTTRAATITRYTEVRCDKMGDKRKATYKEVKHAISKLQVMLSKSFITKIKGDTKITLNLPANIEGLDKKILFKKGEGLFKVFNKLNDMLGSGLFLKMPPIDQMPEFKTFSSVNIGARSAQIVFSSDGIDGAWDLATMSMRGINSCQSWWQANAKHLSGTIVDPYVGIIYLTSGSDFNGKGAKMIRRSLVRFVVNKYTGVPKLVVERQYPGYNKGAAAIFVAALKKKVGSKIGVEDIGNGSASCTQLYIPLPKVISAGYSIKSYVDSGIQYEEPKTNTSAVAFEKFLWADSKLPTTFRTGMKKIAAKYAAGDSERDRRFCAEDIVYYMDQVIPGLTSKLPKILLSEDNPLAIVATALNTLQSDAMLTAITMSPVAHVVSLVKADGYKNFIKELKELLKKIFITKEKSLRLKMKRPSKPKVTKPGVMTEEETKTLIKRINDESIVPVKSC